jgi:hypothetical protein
MAGWLGKASMGEIINSTSFVCHKNTNFQCAGHMIINAEQNNFVFLAQRMGISLNLSGFGTVFKTKQQCIEHHMI